MAISIYNSIGTSYKKYRRADKRIVDVIKGLLDLPAGSKIADIGAGTGNYSNGYLKDREVFDAGYRFIKFLTQR